MTDETDINVASKICLSVSKDKHLILYPSERETLVLASKILGECYE